MKCTRGNHRVHGASCLSFSHCLWATWRVMVPSSDWIGARSVFAAMDYVDFCHGHVPAGLLPHGPQDTCLPRRRRVGLQLNKHPLYSVPKCSFPDLRVQEGSCSRPHSRGMGSGSSGLSGQVSTQSWCTSSTLVQSFFPKVLGFVVPFHPCSLILNPN